MNRSATRRAIGLAVTCRRRNSEPAAFSNVAFSMAPTIPRREAADSGGRGEGVGGGGCGGGGCGQPRTRFSRAGLLPGRSVASGWSRVADGSRRHFDGFDVPAVAADGEDDDDEHGGENEGGHREGRDGDGVSDGRHDGGGWDGEDPGPDDAAGHAPADGGQTAGGADADDGAGDGVGGGDRDAEERGQIQRAGGGRLGREAADRLEGGDPLAEGLDDPPAPRQG